MSSYSVITQSPRPGKRYADENSENQYHCGEINYLQDDPRSIYDTRTLHLMEEFNATPLSPISLNTAGYDIKPRQTINGSRKKRVLVIPEKNPSFRAYRDQFVFLQSAHNQSRGIDHFSKLSDEIVLQVFQWLPKTTLIKCAEVCKRWRNLSYDESLWTKYDMGKKYVKAGVVGTLIQRGVSMLRLAMSEMKSPIFLKDEFKNQQRFSRLQYLDLSLASISIEGAKDILAVCNRLKKLSVEGITLDEDCCKFIAQNEHLEVLNMSMCKGLTSGGLSEIAKNCVRLKEWNLAWTHLDMPCMFTFLPLLSSSLIRFNISGHRKSFDDRALLFVMKRCPNLVELDVSDCHLLTDVSFIPLIKICTKLEHLHISRTYQIPSECYKYLKNLKHLKKLEIFRTLTEDCLAELREYIPEIKINTEPLSTIARPTTGIRRTSIWGLRVRE